MREEVEDSCEMWLAWRVEMLSSAGKERSCDMTYAWLLRKSLQKRLRPGRGSKDHERTNDGVTLMAKQTRRVMGSN